MLAERGGRPLHGVSRLLPTGQLPRAIRFHRPKNGSDHYVYGWSRLGSNQRPPACEAGALPLSYETGAERRTRTKISTRRATGRKYRRSSSSGAPMASWNLCGPAQVDYRRASHRATISSVARGCGAVGSAQPCQGWGRGFESRHPLEGAHGINPAVEWPSGEATACKAVHTGSIPVSTSRFVSPARLAQRESASLTRKRSLVQSQYRAPQFVRLRPGLTGPSLYPRSNRVDRRAIQSERIKATCYAGPGCGHVDL